MTTNHYEVLGLPHSTNYSHEYNQHDIKQAYKRALLQHHPDKSTSKKILEYKPTIDDLTKAHKELSHPLSRSKHDQALRLKEPRAHTSTNQTYSGLETMDLDDLDYDEVKSMWYRECRCGNERGYQVMEEELEREVENGEIFVGCGGCSLWLKVVFHLAEDG